MAGKPIIYLAKGILQFAIDGTPPGAITDFSGDVTTAEVVVESGDDQSVVTLDAVRHVRQGIPAYSLHLVAMQDWSSAGLSRYLWDHAGQAAYFSINAYNSTPGAETPYIRGRVMLTETAFGGEVETWLESELTLPCLERPELLTSTPAIFTQAGPGLFPVDYSARPRSVPEPATV